MIGKIHKKTIYLLFLFVVMLGFWVLRSTFAKFSNDYITENDAVGFSLNFDLKMSDFEEYEDIRVDANSYEVFNVNIKNSTDDTLYYGIWYKISDDIDNIDDIIVARLEDNLVGTSGEINSLDDKTVSVLIKNNSDADVVVHIGIASSNTSTQDISYLGGKHLITGSLKEVDYDYEEASKKYVSSIDNNTYFIVGSRDYDATDEVYTFVANHTGAYKIEAWGAKYFDQGGGYTSGIIKLEENDVLYLTVGRENTSFTDVRLVSSQDDVDASLNSRIMIAGTTEEASYISGHLGSISSIKTRDELLELCVTGLESIECSYHPSFKIFKHTKMVNGDSEMVSFDGDSTMYGNMGDGHIKITPVVPTIQIPDLSVKIGEKLDVSDVTCLDTENGCYIVRVSPEDTSDLVLGIYPISFMVSDDDGIVYRYLSSFEVVE